MVTLKDVAKKAGVSMATVSRVVNGSGIVTEKLEKKVREAINELGYYSNELARGLSQGGINAVGVVVPDISDPYFGEILRGIDDILSPAGYTILFNNTDNDVKMEQQCLKNMRSMGLAGYLVYCCQQEVHDFDFITNNPAVVVFISGNEIPDYIKAYKLPMNFHKSLMLAVQHLYGLGKRNLQLCFNSSHRYDSFFNDIEKEVEKKYSIQCKACFSTTTAADTERVILNHYKQYMPDGIITHNDIQAVSVIQALHKQGKKVPEDVSIISLGNTVLATSSNPPLTSIGPSGYQVGLAGAKYFLEILKNEGLDLNEPMMEIEELVKPEVIVRGSCGCREN